MSGRSAQITVLWSILTPCSARQACVRYCWTYTVLKTGSAEAATLVVRRNASWQIMSVEFNNQAQLPVSESTGSMVHRLPGTVPPLYTANPHHHHHHFHLPTSPRKQRGGLTFHTAETTSAHPIAPHNTTHPHHNTTVDGAPPRLRPDSPPRPGLRPTIAYSHRVARWLIRVDVQSGISHGQIGETFTNFGQIS